MLSHVTFPFSSLVDSLTLKDVPAISDAVAGIPDRNSPSFRLTILWTHHDGALICINIPAGSPVRTLKYILVVMVLPTLVSVARITPTVTFTGSPLHIGIDIPPHMYSSLASIFLNVSVSVIVSGVVSSR